MSSESKYSRDLNIPFQEVQGRVVILSTKLSKSFELNETASFIWTCLKTNSSLNEIAESVTNEFEITFSDALIDSELLIKDLLERELIQVEN